MKKLFFLFTLSIFALGQMWGANYTFNSGTTIYIDCRNFADQIKIPKANTNGYEDNKRDGNTIYAVTFTADVTWSTSSTFMKPYPGGSSQSVKFQVPGDGQNCVLVAFDGKSFSWTTYDPSAPSVAFTNTFPASIGVGEELEFLSTHVSAQNVDNPTYTFYVKKGSGSYGSAVSSYTFNEGGSYTVKVEVRENGTGDALAFAEKTIGCTYTIYFKDNLNWGKVYVHFYPDNQTFSPTNGVGGNAAEINEKMSQISSTVFYQYTFIPSKDYTKVCFTYSNQNNYNDFYDNQCSWSPSGLDFANGLVLWIPDGSASESLNNCTYYNTGTWSVYPPVDPAVSFSGLSSTLVQGQNVVFAATSENVTNPAYTFYVKQGEGEYGSAVTNYTFNTTGSYTVKVEVREEGASGVALAYAEQNVTCKAYYLMKNNRDNKGEQVAVCSSTNGTDIVATYYIASAGNYYFYVTTDPASNANNNCDYLNGNQTLSDGGSGNTAYLYGTSNYEHSYKLEAPHPGEYTFTLILGSSNKFKCDYPANTSPSVAFSGLPATVSQGQEVTFAATSEYVTNPTYTFYVKKGNGEYGSAVSSYTFNEGGTYTIKVEVRENGAGEALAYAEQNIGCTSSYSVYFRNTVNWSNVWIHLYTSDKTFGGNGVGSKKASVNAQMTLVANTTEYYEYSYEAAEPYTKVCFTKEEQNNYDNFHNNECSWSDSGYDAANGLLLWTPDQNTTSSINSCTYYNTGNWTAFAPGEPNVSFVNLSSTIAKGSHVAFEAEALNVSNPTFRFYVKQGEGEYGAAVTAFDFNDEGAYTVKVEVRSNDSGDALAYAEQNVTCATLYTVYFKNTPGWANVYVHFYSDSQTFGNNGVGGQDALLQAQMEQIGTSDIYTYSFTSSVEYIKVCFTRDEQFNYGQFHNNQCSWSDAGLNYATNEILWIPNGIISQNINSCPYYDGKWFVYPYAEAVVAFISLPAEVENGQAINLANYVVSMNVADPAYTFYAKQGSDAYSEITNPYTFPATGTYSVKVEVRENGEAGSALAYDEAEITVPLIGTEFFLAGSFNNWSTSANCFRKATNDAEEASVTITINEYSDITFKVIESNNWIGATDLTLDKDHNSVTLGNESLNNIHLTPYAAGDYIFTLNLNTRLLTVTYPEGAPMPTECNIFAAGDFNDWAQSSSSYKFTVDGDAATLTLQNLEADNDYEFKLIYNGAWLGADYVIKYHYNWEIAFAESTSANAVLKTFKAGNYILTFTISTGLLTVTYPTDGLETKQVEILAQAGGYATFYSNKGWDYPSEVEAYYVSGVTESGNLTMVPLQGYIPAWVPVILHATPETYTFYECDDETWIDGNMLKGTIANETINNDNVHYIMTLSNGVPGLYWPYGTDKGVGAFENKAGKAYLEVPVTTPIPAPVIARRGYLFTDPSNVPTDIDNVQSDKLQSTKVILNGQLLIIRDGKIYNAQGAVVK